MAQGESESTRERRAAPGQMDGVRPDVLLLDNDLFFVVKVTDTLKHSGYMTRAVKTEAAFERSLRERPPAVAMVNTTARGVDFRRAISLARDAGIPVVAFGSHVDLPTQEAARHAGATRVIANARVASDLPGVIRRVLDGASDEKPASDGE